MPAISWLAKLLLKVTVGAIPVPYSALRRIGLGRHGRMDSFEYALDVVTQHVRNCGVEGQPFSALELGPGDSLASAVLAHGLGCREIALVDVGRFASDDLEFYRDLAVRLKARGVEAPDLSHVESVEGLCTMLDAPYLTDGLTSLRSLADGQYDAVWSQAVLEHVHAAELEPVLVETFRVLRPGGRASHRVDLQDHLAGSLNNLRFSTRVWESALVRNSGAYTNRLPANDYVTMARRIGFEVVRFEVERWDRLPLARRKMASEFAWRPERELLVKAFDLVLQRPAGD